MNNKNESGRSMVEMLGVLAVIGVLSVGGIAGYKYAMQHVQWMEFQDLMNQADLAYLSLKDEVDLTQKAGEDFYDYQHSVKIELCNTGLIDKKYCGDENTRYLYVSKMDARFFVAVTSNEIRDSLRFGCSWIPEHFCAFVPSMNWDRTLFDEMDLTLGGKDYYEKDGYAGFIEDCKATVNASGRAGGFYIGLRKYK